MQYISISEISDKYITRNDGFNAVMKLKEIFYGAEISKNVKPIRKEWKGDNLLQVTLLPEYLILDLPSDQHISHSFLDEIIYRLHDVDILDLFGFLIHDDGMKDKIQKICNDRSVEVKVIIDNIATFLKPNHKKSEQK